MTTAELQQPIARPHYPQTEDELRAEIIAQGFKGDILIDLQARTFLCFNEDAQVHEVRGYRYDVLLGLDISGYALMTFPEGSI